MSTITRDSVVREDTTSEEFVAAGVVALSAVLFALGLAALVEVVTITDPVAGLPLVTLLGGLLLGVGGAVTAFGLGSRFGLVQTQPQASAGVVAAVAFAGVWFVVGGLVGSQTLGLDTVGWLVAALLAGTGGFALTAFPREDVGSTAPAGAVAVFGGLVLLTGTIGPGWEWVLGGFEPSATIFADTAVPLVVMTASLLTGWAAAKSYGGFGARGRHVGAYVLIYLVVLSILSVLVGLVLFVVVRGAPRLFQNVGLGGPGLVQWPFLTNGVGLLTPNELQGVFPAIVGTVWLVVGATAFAVPTGVGAAVFLTEYAERGRFTQVVEVATNGLWSTPSIVFGLFGAAFLIPRFPTAGGASKSLVAGMLTLGFMFLPLVLITSREAVLAVPDEYRDASAALGVSKWQTVRSVVLPAAIPGVTTGLILGIGRIAGETAPLLLTVGGGVLPDKGAAPNVLGGFQFAAQPPFVTNPELMTSVSALPYQLYALITAGLGAQSGALDDPDQFAWGLALTLLLVVLSFYAIGIVTRLYFRRKLHQ